VEISNDGKLVHDCVCVTLSRYSMTPLMYAARQGRITVVESLLSVTTDVNFQDSKGFTVCNVLYIMSCFVGLWTKILKLLSYQL